MFDQEYLSTDELNIYLNIDDYVPGVYQVKLSTDRGSNINRLFIIN